MNPTSPSGAGGGLIGTAAPMLFIAAVLVAMLALPACRAAVARFLTGMRDYLYGPDSHPGPDPADTGGEQAATSTTLASQRDTYDDFQLDLSLGDEADA